MVCHIMLLCLVYYNVNILYVMFSLYGQADT
jgi:hypothetical protein